MSTNTHARPNSRRNFLTALAAGTMAGGATFGTQRALALASSADSAAAIKAAYLDVRVRYDAASAVLDEHWDAYTNLACSNRDDHLPDSEHTALVHAFERETGMDGAFRDQERTCDEIEALCERASSLPRSLERVELIAFLFKEWRGRRLWETPKEERYGRIEEITEFVDTILAGVGRA